MRWKPIKPLEIFDGSDPYFQWRLGEGAKGGDLDRPVLVRLKDGVPARDFAKRLEETDAESPSARVPAFYTPPRPGLEEGQWCTALANQEFFQRLRTDHELASLISRIAVLPPIVPQRDGDEAAIREASEPPFDYPEPATVVIGIIDYGIAFAHERFRRSELESRIEYMWVQDAPSGGRVADQRRELDEAPGLYSQAEEKSASREGRVEAEEASADREDHANGNPVPYGREITAGNINAMLQASAGRGCVDEDTLYRQAAGLLGRRWLRSVSQRVAHGTHVMDLACGHDLDDEEGNRRPIVCVQLPEATTADTSGENLDAYAFDGIRYILDRADEIAQRRPDRKHLPVVINFSYGNVAGPHDGTSDLELAVDEFIRLRRKTRVPLEVVLPSGNSHLGRLHARFAFEPQGEPVDLHWRVLPDDRTPSFLEIWLPGAPSSNGEARVAVQVTTPGGASSDQLDDTTPGAGLQLSSPKGEVLCEVRYCRINAPTNRGMFLVALQPTREGAEKSWGGAAPVAPSGTWKVTLANKQLHKDQFVEAWIQRDDTPYGFPRRGRQSYFDQPCYRLFDAQGREIEDDRRQGGCTIKRAGSMNAIATGQETIVVGGCLRSEKRPAKYSAGGRISPTASSQARAAAQSDAFERTGPDMLAVSDDSIVHRGILAAGTRSGSVVALNGTSVAAPQVTRAVADELAKRIRASRPALNLPAQAGRKLAAGLAKALFHPPPDAFVPPQPGRERTGAGLVAPPQDPARKRGLRSRR